LTVYFWQALKSVDESDLVVEKDSPKISPQKITQKIDETERGKCDETDYCNKIKMVCTFVISIFPTSCTISQ